MLTHDVTKRSMASHSKKWVVKLVISYKMLNRSNNRS